MIQLMYLNEVKVPVDRRDELTGFAKWLKLDFVKAEVAENDGEYEESFQRGEMMNSSADGVNEHDSGMRTMDETRCSPRSSGSFQPAAVLSSTLFDNVADADGEVPALSQPPSDKFTPSDSTFRSRFSIALARRYKNPPHRRSRYSMFPRQFLCRYCPNMKFYSERGRHNHELTCCFNENSRSFSTCDVCGQQYLSRTISAAT